MHMHVMYVPVYLYIRMYVLLMLLNRFLSVKNLQKKKKESHHLNLGCPSILHRAWYILGAY